MAMRQTSNSLSKLKVLKTWITKMQIRQVSSKAIWLVHCWENRHEGVYTRCVATKPKLFVKNKSCCWNWVKNQKRSNFSSALTGNENKLNWHKKNYRSWELTGAVYVFVLLFLRIGVTKLQREGTKGFLFLMHNYRIRGPLMISITALVSRWLYIPYCTLSCRMYDRSS